MSFPPRRRVRLWFGRHQIADYIGEPASAARYEAAMRRRFPGLDITNHPLAERPVAAEVRRELKDNSLMVWSSASR